MREQRVGGEGRLRGRRGTEGGRFLQKQVQKDISALGFPVTSYGLTSAPKPHIIITICAPKGDCGKSDCHW